MFTRPIFLVLVLSLQAATVLGASASGEAEGNEVFWEPNCPRLSMEVYWDCNCTNEVFALDWQIVVPGESSDIIVFIKNAGNVNVTLSIASDNWLPPSAASHFTLSWNYSGETLELSQVIPTTLTLAASPDTDDLDCSFDVVISGTYELMTCTTILLGFTQIIPELPQLIALTVFMITTMLSAAAYRRVRAQP